MNKRFDTEETGRFEAIACLKWLLLDRISDVLKRENTIERVIGIINKNSYLNPELAAAL